MYILTSDCVLALYLHTIPMTILSFVSQDISLTWIHVNLALQVLGFAKAVVIHRRFKIHERIVPWNRMCASGSEQSPPSRYPQ